MYNQYAREGEDAMSLKRLETLFLLASAAILTLPHFSHSVLQKTTPFSLTQRFHTSMTFRTNYWIRANASFSEILSFVRARRASYPRKEGGRETWCVCLACVPPNTVVT